jgi:hypothetical protein
MRIRFGLVTDEEMGEASANALSFVPELRRTPAWVISVCGSSRAPGGPVSGGRPGGLLVVFVGDQAPATVIGSWYTEKHNSTGGSDGGAPGNPDAATTPFLSVRWKLVAERGGHMLLRYQTRPCYTLDHVNTGASNPDEVTVILSTGPGSACPSPSATAPYIEISEPRHTRLKHGPTGSLALEPISS